MRDYTTPRWALSSKNQTVLTGAEILENPMKDLFPSLWHVDRDQVLAWIEALGKPHATWLSEARGAARPATGNPFW